MVATDMVATIWISDVPMTTLVGTRKQVDQRRHQDEAAADAEERAEEADADAEHHHRDHADIELRALEAHLEGQPVDPVVLAGLPERRRLAAPRIEDGADRTRSASGRRWCRGR